MEFDPLFEPGIVDITHENFYHSFVKPFDNPNQREYLLERFEIFLNQLRELEVSMEIWINGSFATKKPEPADIDLAIFLNPDEVNGLPEDKKNTLNDMVNSHEEIKLRYHCDTHFLLSSDDNMRSYWRGWFGFSRNENPKGIPRLII